MSHMSLKDAEYLVEMNQLAEEGLLQSNKVCHDCDELFYNGEMLKAERDHTTIRYAADGVIGGRDWTIVIGCAGYHEMKKNGYPKTHEDWKRGN